MGTFISKPNSFVKELFILTKQFFEVEEQINSHLSKSSASVSGKIRIVADSAIHIIKILKSFRKNYPDVIIDLTIGNSKEVTTSIRNYDAEIGVIGSPVEGPDLQTLTLETSKIKAIASKKFFNKIPGFSYNPTALRFSRDEVRYSNSSLIGKFSSVVYNQSDKLLVTYYLGPSSMATYEVLSKIPSLFSKVIGLSAYAIVPSISSSDINTVTASKIFNLGLEYMIKLIVPVLVFFIIYSDALLEWWVGDEFLSVSNLLVLMLFWSFLTIFTFGGNILLGLNVRLKEINGFRIIQATIKVVALFLMIGYFGLYAVPISFILSMSALLYLWRIFHKEFQISYKKLLRLTMSILMISSTIYLTYYLSFELSSIFRITLGLSHLAILLTMLWHKKIILIINDLKS